MKNIIAIVNGQAGQVDDDPWVLLPEQPGTDKSILALCTWQTVVNENNASQYGVMLEPDDDPLVLEKWLAYIPLIALLFPSHRDGRAYSQANLLRTRYHFQGDIRSVGDVLRDQLILMRHCGFSSFAVREDKSVTDALKGLTGFSQIYARSVAQPEPRFRRLPK